MVQYGPACTPEGEGVDGEEETCFPNRVKGPYEKPNPKRTLSPGISEGVKIFHLTCPG
jgi:hypothetical protein